MSRTGGGPLDLRVAHHPSVFKHNSLHNLHLSRNVQTFERLPVISASRSKSSSSLRDTLMYMLNNSSYNAWRSGDGSKTCRRGSRFSTHAPISPCRPTAWLASAKRPSVCPPSLPSARRAPTNGLPVTSALIWHHSGLRVAPPEPSHSCIVTP